MPLKHTEEEVKFRSERMVWMRLGGATLKEIGAEFDLTRERVRQILKPLAETIPELQTPKPAIDKVKVKGFKVTFHRWLAWVGYKHCWGCKTMRDMCDFSPNTQICRECNAKRTNANYHNNPNVREYYKRWQKENSELARSYRERFRAKHAEKIRERERQYHAANRDKICARMRERYARKKAERLQETA